MEEMRGNVQVRTKRGRECVRKEDTEWRNGRECGETWREE